MRLWLTWLAATMTGATMAQPAVPASTLRFDAASFPQAMEAYRLWLASGRSLGVTDAAMTLVAPGIQLNASNHSAYGPKIQPMIAAINKRLVGENADKSDDEAAAAQRVGTLLTPVEWQALLISARTASALPQAYIDATLAIAMLSAAGISEQTSPAATGLWTRLRRVASAYDPAPGKSLPPFAANESAAFDKLKTGLEGWVKAQRDRSATSALGIGKALYPDYASGKARQVGNAAKIEAFMESVRMPEVARFYGALWSDIQTSEISLKVHELARAMGRPEQWDSDGSRRLRMLDFILPRVQKLGADIPMSDAVAGMLTELISDADIDWMRHESASARGQKLMPTVERLIIASFWRRGIESARVWQGNTYRAAEVARDATQALRGDPAGRDPIMQRMEGLEKKSQPVYERLLKHQVERTRAVIAHVMKRDEREIRAYMQTLQ